MVWMIKAILQYCAKHMKLVKISEKNYYDVHTVPSVDIAQIAQSQNAKPLKGQGFSNPAWRGNIESLYL